MVLTAQQYNDDAYTIRLYHFDEGTGTTCIDQHGTGNLTLDNENMRSTKFKMGVGGVKTNGAQIADNGNWTNPLSITMELWMNLDVTFNSSTAGGEHAILYGDDGANHQVMLALMGSADTGNGGKLRLRYGYMPTQTTLYSVQDSWTAGVWYHIAATGGVGGKKIYVNGVLDSSNADASRLAATPTFRVMGYGGSTIPMPAGSIDELRISSIQRRDFGNTLAGIDL